MTSIRQPTPIDPNKTYPILWYPNGLQGGCVIRELPGRVLLDDQNPEQYRYFSNNRTSCKLVAQN